MNAEHAPTLRPAAAPASNPAWQLLLGLLLLVLTIVLAFLAWRYFFGSRENELETDYGRQDNSVNGCLALARMFTASGRPVTTRHALTPGVARAETIVWFNTSRLVPSDPVVAWFERWLREGADRTLVFVGRDFDAEPDYWRATAALAPAEQQSLFRARRQFAELRLAAQHEDLPETESCEWFEFENGQASERVRQLSGPWAAGVDAAKASIELNQRLVPLEWQEPLLETPLETLVVRDSPSGGGQLLVVVNGSFLLNAPLVNKENRKLAGRLIDATAPGKPVVFLESDENPRIRADDSQPQRTQVLELLDVWPLNVLLLHFGVLGIIFCFARWPIFGRPQEPAPADLSNFGKHAEALGKLLERAGDRSHAERRLAEYRAMKS